MSRSGLYNPTKSEFRIHQTYRKSDEIPMKCFSFDILWYISCTHDHSCLIYLLFAVLFRYTHFTLLHFKPQYFGLFVFNLSISFHRAVRTIPFLLHLLREKREEKLKQINKGRKKNISKTTTTNWYANKCCVKYCKGDG